MLLVLSCGVWAAVLWLQQVHHISLMRYLEMLKSAEFRDDLDVVSTIHTPKGQFVHHAVQPAELTQDNSSILWRYYISIISGRCKLNAHLCVLQWTLSILFVVPHFVTIDSQYIELS